MKKFFAWFFALLLTGSLILFGVCLVGHQVIAPAMGDEGAPVSDSLIREEKDLARERITALADLYGFDPEPVVAAVNEDVLKDLNSQASLWWSSVLRDGRAGNELRWDTKEVEQILMADPAVQENPDEATLQGFLEEVSLFTDIDTYNTDPDESFVVLMTLHSAKGLEFDTVFIPGMEENTFPSYLSTLSQEEMQEERRLAYVGITRAKHRLYLSCSRSRTLFGKTSYNRPSRFLSELPDELVEEKETKRPEFSGSAGISIGEKRRSDMEKSRQISTMPHMTEDKKEYTIGMRVKHRTFGEGMILNTRPMGSDTLLEIAFDTVDTKKIMANYANLSII